MRASLLQTEFCQPLAKKLMSAKYLTCKTKVQLFSSLVLSVLLYGCETWPEPSMSQGRRLEAFQMKCLRRLAGEPRVLTPGRERISDTDLRRQLEIPSIESQIRRAASLIRVAQPSVAALLSVGRKAPADWTRMLLGDLKSLRNACPLFQNLGDPSIAREHWRALIVTSVGDRAMRLSQTYESNWHETPCIKTVDLSCTHAADLPAGALLCPECACECVRVFTSEKARQGTQSYGERLRQ